MSDPAIHIGDDPATRTIQASVGLGPAGEPTTLVAEQLIELGRAMQRAEAARHYQRTYAEAYAGQQPNVDLHWNLGAGVRGYNEVKIQIMADLIGSFEDLIDGACCALEDRVRRLRREVLGDG